MSCSREVKNDLKTFFLVCFAVLVGLFVLSALAAAGFASYKTFQNIRNWDRSPNLKVDTASTGYYTSPSNGARWFYHYPFSPQTVEQIIRETDGYLVPLFHDNRYYVLDCPDYHLDAKCSGNILKYYTDISGESRNVELWSIGREMNNKFNNTSVFGCVAEVPLSSLEVRVLVTTIVTAAMLFLIGSITWGLCSCICYMCTLPVEQKDPDENEIPVSIV